MPNTSKKILLIEDEESLSNVVELNLKLEGFNVDCISNGRTAFDHAHQVGQYDLVILDVMLPEVSGWDICEMYKSVADTPILFVSAKGTSSDKIKGLKLGADDFLAKPFDLEELLLRVQVLILRHQGKKSNEQTLNLGEFQVNLLTYEVKKDDQLISTLSKREIKLLQLFHEHEGEVLSRDFILDKIWGKDAYPTSRTIDNYILSFRKLFEKDAKNPEYFHSIRGVGYKFVGKK
ncbi:response regulator transcription factor [Brumimicrobium aurantiacum]|uniref:DNA-binding response regulator n=1 Tax=Brumimicrobium aurantiacum TaxID=1737063 RepID=A0A3E1F225_9FLAO|nr:response regulator transcription factor [Brumimicrobium aurantiacum]RFC55813.1 DNA-binding response regulator [Brumimicrobium aurantiacum]